ncbi:SDR family NAD(P)-dependent oxidoreductase [Tessaracoccus flavus]|uniref:Short-chain dehydrogenase n=1 Tax=Tessaracoccus flavus TaxID=1610493 RepID=A0A1Q2CH00_9ACTN|nr:SDR family NAD(P)-dependent oxidoreductase [Tessaracoccus flavus]AQP45330.1 short-chain dehydrogenase [Tessaracoccus flavus]SDY48577.1 sorbitol-6-phosphate 2-dehydrogenase [Tessaracoccus flavus]
MTLLEIAPLVRGAYLARHGAPVLVSHTPGGGESPAQVRAGSADDLPAALAEAELPLPGGVVVEVGEEQVAFSVRTLGEVNRLPGARDTEARSAASRSAVVSGKVAVVTGGAQGFGAEIVHGLVDSGAFVYIADLNGDGASALAAEVGDHRAAAITVNVADEASVQAMAEQIAATTGGLDLVVSNAGIVRAGSVLEQDLSSFALTTDINYTAFFLVTKHLGRLLAAQHRTAPDWLTDVIQINSKSGLTGSNKNGAYAGSKFGGLGLVQSFALELVEHGVKVNAICPGNFYDGPLWSDPDKGLFVQYLRSGKVPGATTVDEVREFYESKVPLRRGTTGADVMRAVYYIVEQAYETGQAVPVTGGQVMLSS